MKNIIINNTDSNSYDSKMEKARAIIINENGNLLVSILNGSLILPGGTIESNETPTKTLRRELIEEAGIENINLKKFIKISYYHNIFPKYKQVGFEKRLNIVNYYYSSSLVNIDNNKSNLTEYEKESNMQLVFLSIEDIKSRINIITDNIWQKPLNLELSTILELIEKEALLNKVKEARSSGIN